MQAASKSWSLSLQQQPPPQRQQQQNTRWNHFGTARSDEPRLGPAGERGGRGANWRMQQKRSPCFCSGSFVRSAATPALCRSLGASSSPRHFPTHVTGHFAGIDAVRARTRAPSFSSTTAMMMMMMNNDKDSRRCNVNTRPSVGPAVHERYVRPQVPCVSRSVQSTDWTSDEVIHHHLLFHLLLQHHAAPPVTDGDRGADCKTRR